MHGVFRHQDALKVFALADADVLKPDSSIKIVSEIHPRAAAWETQGVGRSNVLATIQSGAMTSAGLLRHLGDQRRCVNQVSPTSLRRSPSRFLAAADAVGSRERRQTASRLLLQTDSILVDTLNMSQGVNNGLADRAHNWIG